MLRDVEGRGGHADVGTSGRRGGRAGTHRSNRRGILALPAAPAGRRPTRRPIDRARPSRPGQPAPAAEASVAAPRRARPDRRRRSSPATCATASRRASIAATSSRPTPPAGSSASSATRTGSSPSARRSSRSALLALIEAGGIEAFDLEPAEIAILASSHSGEDLHVRTLQGLYRRSGVSQAQLACGSEGAPLDALTAARLARDGEKAGPIRHMCSGQHTVSLLLSPAARLGRRPTTGSRATRRRSPIATPSRGAYGTTPGEAPDRDRRLRRRDLRLPAARGRPRLRDAGRPGGDPGRRPARRRWPRSLTTIRDAMLANPEMVGGRHDRLDTSLMKAAPGPARQQGRDGGAARRSRSCPGRATGRSEAAAVRDGGQDRGRRRLRSRDVGGLGRGAPPGRRRSTAARCASWPATTARRSSIRTAGSAPRRSPSSNSRRWASSSADRMPADGRTDADARPTATMALDPDPYRTLGLSRGASLDEVKRAYRRLAKANHPDAAGRGGAAALPGDPGGLRAAGRWADGGRVRRPSAAPPARPPWEADPDRSDATRRAYGGRAADRATGRSRRRHRVRGGHGRGGAATGRPARARPAAAGAGSASGRRAAPPGAPAGADGGPAPATRRARRAPADAPRERQPNKATLGSTSYDGVDAGPFEPDWRGASWYGTTSGTYWTLNPKEYADPRKHGPEYQARARRAARRPGAGGATRPDGRRRGRRPDADAAEAEPTPARPRRARPTRRAPGGTRRPARRGPAPDARPAAPPRPTATAARPPRAADDAPPPPDLGRAAGRPRPGPDRRAVRRRCAAGSSGRSSAGCRSPSALGWLVGEMTGCGRFAATCDGSADPFVLALQVARPRGPARSSRRSRSLATIAALIAARRRGRCGALILSATGDGRRRRARAGRRSGPCCSSPGSPGSRSRSSAGSAPPRRRRVPYPEAMPRRHDQRDLSAAAQEYLLALRVMAGVGRRRPGHRGPDRPPPRGHHPGRQRDVPAARRRRPGRPCRGPRPAPDARPVGRPPTGSSAATPCSSGC